MEADAEAMDDQTNGMDGNGKDAGTDLGEEALQRAARIEYAIKASKMHQNLLGWWGFSCWKITSR